MNPTNHYGATAARKHGKPGREVRPQSITIDIHSHVAVPAGAEFVKPHLDLATIPLAHFATPETKALAQKQEADRRSRITQYDERLKDMDAMGVDMQLVMPPPPQCYFTVPVDVAVKATRMVNDGVAQYVAGKPDRFVALGTVPLQDGAEAAKELERSMGTLGFKGAQILTNVAGKELSDPAYAPFWAKAEALGALVVIHPNGFTQGERLSRFYFNNVIGNPFDTTVALHYLIFDGVLASQSEDSRRARRRLPRRLLGPHRSRLGARSDAPAQAADRISQARLCRQRRVHPAPAQVSYRGVRDRPRAHGHRLSVRHGGFRPDRPSRRERARRLHHGGDRRRQREEVIGVERAFVARMERSEIRDFAPHSASLHAGYGSCKKSSTAVSAITAAGARCFSARRRSSALRARDCR